MTAKEYLDYKLEIKKINRELNESKKKRAMFAALAGAFTIGTFAAIYFSGIDLNAAAQAELQSLGSWQQFRDQFLEFKNPAILISLTGAISSYAGFIKQAKRYNKANEDFYNRTDFDPGTYEASQNNTR